MKNPTITRWALCLAAITLTVLACPETARAQGTAFTYQGKLAENGLPAEGSFDFTFAIFEASAEGTPIGTTLTNSAVMVSNSVFTVELDFGPGIFTGEPRWLEIAVRTNASLADYTVLSPRHPLSPVPYAITAANLSGLVPGGSLAGSYSNAVFLANPANRFVGAFAGNGSALSNVNAASVGGLGAGNFWQTGGNAGLNDNQFLGTTDNQPLVLKVNGTPALRLEPQSPSPNLVGGHPSNSVSPGVYGAAIGGGGDGAHPNQIQAHYGVIGGGASNVIQSHAGFPVIVGGRDNVIQAYASLANIGGGARNRVGEAAYGAVIGGGFENTIESNITYTTIGGGGYNKLQGSLATIGGGYENIIRAEANAASIGGGRNNAIEHASQYATISGGLSNLVQTNAWSAVIGGGWRNRIQTNASGATVGGGFRNRVYPNATNATIGGGELNDVRSGANHAALGGGFGNQIHDGGEYATIGGGYVNAIHTNAHKATIGGGEFNAIELEASRATIGGGERNLIQSGAGGGMIGGGSNNRIGSGSGWATVAGGLGNNIGPNAGTAVIGGGYHNLINSNAHYATIPGGYSNTASKVHTFAAGRRANAAHSGSFVWADATDAEFKSTANDQFLIRASGGVGINTNNPRSALHVAGIVSANGFAGDGTGVTNLNASGINLGTIADSLLSTNVALRNGGNVFSGDQILSGGRLGLGTIAPQAPLHVAGNARLEKNDGRLVLATPVRNDSGRYGIQFSNNVLGLFLGDDTQEQVFGFYSQFASQRAYDAKLQVHGQASGNWNAYLELTHDGTQGIVATDTNALELRPAKFRALRLEPGTNGAPNLVGGSPVNRVETGVVGATIGGGGALLYGSGGFGGWGGGGGPPTPLTNRIAADFGTVSGGADNSIGAGALASGVAGGYGNLIQSNSIAAQITGGAANRIGPDSHGAAIAGGWFNTIAGNAPQSSIGGGSNNVILDNAVWSTVAGGSLNAIGEDALGSTIGGGAFNAIKSNALSCTIGGGGQNTIGQNSVGSVIGGGGDNWIATNTFYSIIPGGAQNVVGGNFGFAAGYRAKARHQGTFVWADSQVADFASSGSNQFLIRAAGGVGIGTPSPQSQLHVSGGQWNLDLSEGDFKIGNASHRLKIGVATGGGGAGDARIRAHGGSHRLILGSETNDVLTIQNSRVGIGTISPTETLEVVGNIKADALFVNTATVVSNLNADRLDGLDSSGFWKISGNSNTVAGMHLLGTRDNEPLEFSVFGARALRLEPTPTNGAVNVIGGSELNKVERDVVGATIAGGGTKDYLGNPRPNYVGGNYSTIAGGIGQTNAGKFCTVGGGYRNRIEAEVIDSTIGGGSDNCLSGALYYATIGGGLANEIHVVANYGTIGGGTGNKIHTNSGSATIAGGYQNEIRTNAGSATIAGGNLNFIHNDSSSAAIGGGWFNNIYPNASYGAIAGGWANMIQTNAAYAMIPGGFMNRAGGTAAFAAGFRAKADHGGSFVWADAQQIDFASTTENQFLIRASGGVGIGTTSPESLLDVRGGVTVQEPSGHNDNLIIKKTGGVSAANAKYVFSHRSSGTELWLYTYGANGYRNLQGWDYANNAVRFPATGNTLYVDQNNGRVGVARTPAANALEVEGNASKTAAGSWVANSDARIKQDIQPVTNALEKLNQVELVSFHYTEPYRTEHPSIEDRPYLNVVAQQYAKVFPEHVKSSGEKVPGSEEAILQVDTHPLTIYSAAAIQELNRKLEQQMKSKDERIAQLERRLEALEALLKKVDVAAR